jgi:hypothetical protein
MILVQISTETKLFNKWLPSAKIYVEIITRQDKICKEKVLLEFEYKLGLECRAVDTYDR